MKFKTKEELISGAFGKRYTSSMSIELVFESFAERIEFFQKYKVGDSCLKNTTGVSLFREDFPEIYKNADFRENSWWNDWLFDYCFGDVKEEEEVKVNNPEFYAAGTRYGTLSIKDF